MADSSRRTYIIDISAEGQSHWPLQSINKVNIRLTNLEGSWAHFPVSKAVELLLGRAADSCLEQPPWTAVEREMLIGPSQQSFI